MKKLEDVNKKILLKIFKGLGGTWSPPILAYATMRHTCVRVFFHKFICEKKKKKRPTVLNGNAKLISSILIVLNCRRNDNMGTIE